MDRSRAAAALDARLVELGWTNAALADRAQVDPSTIGDFLSGRRWPTRATQGAIEAAVGWTPGTLGRVAHGEPEPADAITFVRPPGVSTARWTWLKGRLSEVYERAAEEL